MREAEAGRLQLPLGAVAAKALVHGHCHQKSFGAFKPVEQVLRLIPDLSVETIESSCCGMAGAFGYGADTYQASIEMAELSLLPAVRRADQADAHRRRRHLVPAPDQGWHGPCSPSRRARAGDEPRSRAIQLKLPPPPQRNRSMAELTLDIARKILDAALAKGVEKKLKPLVVTVLDARGCVKVTAAQDGTSLMRGRDRARQGLWRARAWAWDRGRCSSARRSRPISSAR